MSGGPCPALRRAQEVLRAYEPDLPAQRSLRRQYLAHLSQHPDGLWRGGPTHLTVSCFVLSPDGGQVLLTLHRKGGFWVQPGGHVETTDAGLAQAALREMREETGVHTELADSHLGPFDLHRHQLSAAFGACREHLDVAYLALAAPQTAVRVSEESDDVAWWPVDHLPANTVPDLAPRLERARAVVRGPSVHCSTRTPLVSGLIPERSG